MEVNVAINIKVETLFWGANIFCEVRPKIARGVRKYFLQGEEIFPLLSDFVMGETLFRDTSFKFSNYWNIACSHWCVLLPKYSEAKCKQVG